VGRREYIHEEPKPETIKTSFFVSQNQEIYEEVVDGTPRWVVYHYTKPNSKPMILPVESMEKNGVIYEVLSGDELTEGLISLPSGLGDYESEAKLVEEIQAFIHKWLDVSPEFEELSAYYVLLSWFYDPLYTVPYLRALGDTGTGKSRFLDVVGKLCYKPIKISGAVTPSPIYRLLKKWKGTLVIDEADFYKSDESHEIVKILNCGFERGTPVVRSNKDNPNDIETFYVFGPKVIATRRTYADKALEARCITEVMKETSRTDIPATLDQTFFKEQEKLRRKLLHYRLKSLGNWLGKLSENGGNNGKIEVNNVTNVTNVTFDLSGIEPRLKQLASSFFLAFRNNKEILTRFKNWLIKYQYELITERSNTPEGEIVNYLHERVFENEEKVTKVTLVTLHRGEQAEFFGNNIAFEHRGSSFLKITPKEIAEGVSEEFGSKVSPRGVGKYLKSLGLSTEVLKIEGKAQRVVKFTPETLRKLFKRYVPEYVVPEIRGGSPVTNVTNVTNVTKRNPHNALEALSKIAEEYDEMSVSVAMDRLQEMLGVSLEEVNKLLYEMERNGDVYQPKKGIIKIRRREL